MDSLLIISSVVLWVAVAGLSALVFALTRQVGVLYRRIAPAGALMVNQQLNVGDPAPPFTLGTLAGNTTEIGSGGEQLVFFLAPDCPTLSPSARQSSIYNVSACLISSLALFVVFPRP